MPHRPTLADIAYAAGVSKATVSLALRQDPRIPAKTRDRIRAVAQGLGYQPDPAIANMSAYRWPKKQQARQLKIAFVSTGSVYDQGVAFGIQQQAERSGYAWEIYDLGPMGWKEPFGRILHSRGFNGMIIGQVVHGGGTSIDWDQCQHIPAVACCIGRELPPIHHCYVHYFQGVRMAYQQLRARGYRRIGTVLFSHHPPYPDDVQRHSAALYEHRIAPGEGPEIPPLIDAGFDRVDLVYHWFRRHRPDAIISFHDGVYWMLREAGLRIPEDLGYVSLQPEDRYQSSGIDWRLDQLGIAAMDLLDTLVRLDQKGLPELPQVKSIIPAWIEGATIGDGHTVNTTTQLPEQPKPSLAAFFQHKDHPRTP